MQNNEKPLNQRGSLKRRSHNADYDQTNNSVPCTEHVGVVDYVNPRYAYISCPDLPEQDPCVFSEDLLYALHEDKVRIEILPNSSPKRLKARVIEIISRERKEVIGVIDAQSGRNFLVADHKKIHEDVFIPSEYALDAQHNQKVLAEIIEWPSPDRRKMLGRVIRNLGNAGEHNTEMHSILASHGIPTVFPEEVEEEMEKLPISVPIKLTKEDLAQRRDCRQIPTFTIDPETAKDFDDALSVQWIEEKGMWEIGVHIADVTHYVPADSHLEKEALKRGNSVYLVDRTVPMLPELLSNEVCSLKPDEDRLTFSVFALMDADAKVHDVSFAKSIIHSQKRFTYQQAQDLIDAKGKTSAGTQHPLYEALNTLYDISLKLRGERIKNQSIAFYTPELVFQLDKDGVPLAIVIKKPLETHNLVEEFMLLANKSVAEYVQKAPFLEAEKVCPFVYRNHDLPKEESLEEVFRYAGMMGHKFPPLSTIQPEDLTKVLNELIREVEGKDEELIITRLLQKSMAKAKYLTTQPSHFGLGFEFYTHFTSPIRRYADMMVHRLLAKVLEKEAYPEDFTDYQNNCADISVTERRAMDAERESTKYKQVEYMEKHVGENFEGVVSWVCDWGVYVEITSTLCEGMIRLRSLQDDYYIYDKDNMRLVGEKTNKMIKLGDPILVHVGDVNKGKKTIDLLRINHIDEVPVKPQREDRPRKNYGRNENGNRGGGGRGNSNRSNGNRRKKW